MQQYFLAIDIGASSGRHILGSVQNGKIVLEEVYRFKNGLVKTNGHLCWDLKSIFTNIVAGIKKCGELGKIPTTMGIDTWGVDFVLLDEKDEVLGDTVSYRDGRTKGMDAEVAKFLSAEELYARTGIQKVVFNSIYQMMAIKKEHPEYLAQAKRFLMIPEYFNFLLTGNQVNEYTNGTTTQLINAPAKDWDFDLIEKLGYPKEIFGQLCLPKTSVGHFTPAIREEVGFDCEVILPATHDTGSAVLAVPAQGDDFIFLSSGTWSLMGVEILEPNCTEKSRIANFTNEGGYDYRFRYLKNIMGLWMIQSVKAEYENKYSFDDLCNAAMEAEDFHSLVDVNDDCFLAPENMIQAVKDYCARTNQPVPETPGEIAACIYNSLVKSYAETVAELEKMTGRNYAKIHIVGGGCKDGYLNELTAKATGKTVIPGPSEATALGNILSQMLKAGIYANLSEARAASAATLL